MSHYHCEIILPPETTDIEAAIKSVMEPFNENQPADSEHSDKHSFWDFYVIGGRFAGNKLMSRYDKQKLDDFYAWMKEEKVTVSGFQCGKQSLQPESQITKIDAKWNELFPRKDGTQIPCPIFAHSNDQYGKNGKGTLPDDICPLKDAMDVICSRIIFAGKSYSSDTKTYTGELEAQFMLQEDFWNGVNHVKSTWDGTVKHALEMNLKQLEHYADYFKNQFTPNGDWITVTVDYHS